MRTRTHIDRHSPARIASLTAVAFTVLLALTSRGDAAPAAEAVSQFQKEIRPILTEYCYDCHGDGMDKGKVAFDGFKSDEELVGKHDLWLAVLKNLRAGLMPPEKKPRPNATQLKQLEDWIKHEAFGLDPKEPDPGRVTLRRLNRVEYRNTIRDLMGFDVKVEDELPPDDTGYGFDNIGDVLTVSPMLLEKYMQAAESIVAGAVPRQSRVVLEKVLSANAFRSEKQKKGERGRERHSFATPNRVEHRFKAEQAGDYQLVVELEVFGRFDFDPTRCNVFFKADGQTLLKEEFGWQNGRKFRFRVSTEVGCRRTSARLRTRAHHHFRKQDQRGGTTHQRCPRDWPAGQRALGSPEELRSVLHPGFSGGRCRTPRIRNGIADPLRDPGLSPSG